MLSHQEAEKLIKRIPQNISNEDRRVACSVITGVRDDKPLSEIIKYYWLPEEVAQKWWDFFSLSDVKATERKKRGAKTAKLDNFIKSNIGKTFTSNEIVSQCEITVPTLYNYINANRGFFKKVSRGTYLIIDPEQQRKQEK
jgi:hypothetical protein